MTTRHCRWIFLFILAAFLAPYSQAAEERSRPNIILIMADDVGVEGLESYGGTSYRTPQLNRLAEHGLRFTHAYAQPLCTNTRIQLMTGLYNNRNWKFFGILDPNAKTIGHWMSEAGYRTCIAGKWQLQSYDPPDYPGAEKRRGTGMKVEDTGFDEHCLWHTGHTEVKGSRYADPTILQNGKFRDDLKGKYGPDVWVDYINGYLERNQKSEKPFFVYYPMALPHWPMVPTPDSPEWKNPATRNLEDVRFVKDMIEYMDKNVGRIVAKVDELGLAENTLILFYSDNGTHLKVTSQTKTGPVAGGKGEMTDAGTHVPFIARWTGHISHGVNDDLVDSTDFLPTILEAAGRPISKDVRIDGRSFFPQLLGKKGTPREWTFCHFDPRPGWDKDRFQLNRYARDKRYKLYDDGRLFDVPKDQFEKHPIELATAPSDVRSAAIRLQAVLDSMPSPPTPPRD
ncbi:MAG: sulfatase-like hydrolase/transferase [Planctomycetota bacterium]|nr:sulfatase-like hydrolase/transferase [Planctomycetota bacterium]MDA1251405.1 sulfatase-like hydrolase/transferase [Planctomycetota bacterium]